MLCQQLTGLTVCERTYLHHEHALCAIEGLPNVGTPFFPACACRRALRGRESVDSYRYDKGTKQAGKT
jgi:hypothetical protein